jgi:hypothetical protein
VRQLNVELAEGRKTLSLIGALFHLSQQAIDVLFGPLLKESQKEILFVLEMRVDRSLGAASGGGNCIQLGTFIAVADKDFLGCLEQTGVGVFGSELVFVQDTVRHPSY